MHITITTITDDQDSAMGKKSHHTSSLPKRLSPQERSRVHLLAELGVEKPGKGSGKIDPEKISKMFSVTMDVANAWTWCLRARHVKGGDLREVDREALSSHPDLAVMTRTQFAERYDLDEDEISEAISMVVESYGPENGRITRTFSQADVVPVMMMDPSDPVLRQRVDIVISRFVSSRDARSAVDHIISGIRASTTSRSIPLEQVTCHLGPTNSGKTRYAMDRMVEAHRENPDARIVYAGPLRLLAAEVHDHLVDAVGDPDDVGVFTGDHQDNVDAPLLSCTVECAPRSGDLLVVDECHWAMDDDRGRHWTDLITSADYPEIILLGPSECANPLSFMVSDAQNLDIHHHERLCPIEVEQGRGAGGVKHYGTKDVPARSAVVAFSKKAVQGLAQFIAQDTGLTVVSLYGSLPLQVRQERVEMVRSGKADVVVCTDVLGHGVNIPVDRVLFSETTKYDGVIRRDLRIWEAAQIAGRAGRYGHSDAGSVGVLTTPWGTVNTSLVRKSADAAAGRIPTELSTLTCMVSPTLRQLNLGEHDHSFIPQAIAAWREITDSVLSDQGSGGARVRASTMNTTLDNLASVAMALGKNIGDDAVENYGSASTMWTIPLDRLWSLIRGPFDEGSEVLIAAAKVLSGCGDQAMVNVVEGALDTRSHHGRESIESACRQIVEIKSLFLVLSEDRIMERYTTIEALDEAERVLVERYRALGEDSAGVCSCGSRTKAPWLSQCDECFHSSRYSQYGGGYDGGYGGGFRYYRDRDYDLDSDEYSEYRDQRRAYERARSQASREVSGLFSAGQKVKVRTADAEVIKANKVKIRVQQTSAKGVMTTKEVYACFLAEDNKDTLDLPEGWTPFSEVKKPVNPYYQY